MDLRCLWMQESIPIEEVFENLRCTKHGLTTSAAQARLAIFGHNKLEEKKVFTLLFLFSYDWIELLLFIYLFIFSVKDCAFTLLYLFGVNRRASSWSSWGLCGILCHGLWKLLQLWQLPWQMEGWDCFLWFMN